jgi:hypothetical protein
MVMRRAPDIQSDLNLKKGNVYVYTHKTRVSTLLFDTPNFVCTTYYVRL